MISDDLIYIMVFMNNVKKLRVAFLLPSLHRSGPGFFTKNLVDGLSRKGHHVDIFYFKDCGEVIEFDAKINMHKVCLFNSSQFNGYDVVHSTQLIPDMYVGFYLKWCQRSKFISGAHNFIYQDVSMLHGRVKGFAMALVWYIALYCIVNVIVSSNEMKKYYKRRLLFSRVTVVPYGVVKPSISCDSLYLESEIKALSRHKKIIGACGVLIKRKGFCDLINAISNNNDVALCLIGDGPEMDALKELVEKNNIEDRVVFVGQQERSSRYYKYFDVYALTSYSEGFGISMIEALALGIPLVCSDLDIYKEYFGDCDVVRFKPGDVEALRSSIVTVMGNINYYAARSIQIYKKYFSIEVMLTKHEELYCSIIDER